MEINKYKEFLKFQKMIEDQTEHRLEETYITKCDRNFGIINNRVLDAIIGCMVLNKVIEPDELTRKITKNAYVLAHEISFYEKNGKYAERIKEEIFNHPIISIKTTSYHNNIEEDKVRDKKQYYKLKRIRIKHEYITKRNQEILLNAYGLLDGKMKTQNELKQLGISEIDLLSAKSWFAEEFNTIIKNYIEIEKNKKIRSRK